MPSYRLASEPSPEGETAADHDATASLREDCQGDERGRPSRVNACVQSVPTQWYALQWYAESMVCRATTLRRLEARRGRTRLERDDLRAM